MGLPFPEYLEECHPKILYNTPFTSPTWYYLGMRRKMPGYGLTILILEGGDINRWVNVCQKKRRLY